MRLLGIEIENFRSFKKRQRFNFPQEPGLYFMQGLNESEPRLGANGTGKSTIWDAVFWVLFERTTRGLKAGDVSNWDIQQGTEVSLDFYDERVEDCVWTITRTWKPNSWRLSHQAEFITDEAVIDLAKDPGNPVLAAIRMEAEPFLQSILMAQNRPMFLDLERGKQAELFSNVLGLDRWMDYANKASKKASAQDAISRDLERKLARTEGELSSLGKSDFRQSSQDWDTTQAERIARIADDHARGIRDRKGLKERLEQAQGREEAARKALARLEPPKGAREHLEKLRTEMQESRDLLQSLKGRAQALKEQCDATLADDERCPTCGQEWHGNHAREFVEGLTAQADKLSRQHAEEEATYLNLRGRFTEEQDAWDEADAKAAKVQRELEEATREVSTARRALESMDRDLDRMEDRAEELAKERNPYKEMEEDAARRGRQLRVELEDVRDDLDASNSRYGLLSFWVKGFKELRLMEIAEALTELEIEVNSCVTALGLIDWELRFAVDKEGKGGGITRGFSVTVKSPLQPFATPWEAWSGGEGQRLRLAGNMGLGDLIRGRTGSALNLEVWDEPTNGLSPEGISDLLECLATRARTEQRVIFLVDHKAHDFGGFAGHYTIIKAPSGSRIRTGAV